jgi:DNA-binding NarL/FixJ family response regulator
MMQSDSGAANTTLKVAVIEDKRDIREGISFLINATAGYRCTGSYGSMEEAIRCIGTDLPHVVLTDIGLPGMSGIEGISILKERYPGLILLVLSVHDDDGRVFDALCAGASGYLLKNTPPARLIEGLREAVDGGAPMSPDVARRVIALFREFRTPETADYELTPHEVRILRLLVDGHNYRTAAVELGVSVNTIAFHMKRIYEKIRVHSKAEAVSKALRRRLV